MECIMVKPASGLCNMRCSYCFYADEMHHRRQASCGIMSRETMEQVISKVLAYVKGGCTFAFQGGEPTLAGLDFYREWLELEKKYNQKGIVISHALQTNGYLLDQAWCDFLARSRFLTGLSVDGIKAAHDAFRKDAKGEDTYFRILEGARLLKEAGAEFNVLTVVNSRTAPRIRRIYEQYRKLGFAWQQYIACLNPIREKQGEQEYSLTPGAYGQFLIDLFALWEIDFWQGRQPYIRQFENYVGILMGREPESCEQRGYCSRQTVVEADGSVYPCDFYMLDEFCLGSLVKEDFAEIEKRRQQLGFSESSLDHSAQCRQCRYFRICRGGCRRHRQQPGTAEGENYFCESYRMFFDACLPGLRRIAAACMR
ncbi:MAG: anaerobic sulfatase maturase [Lachnospiraceae bacterium]|nr:anaerobic sulfatase maturase [Lachnospiraceae bacterium]